MGIEVVIASPPYREKLVAQLQLVVGNEAYIWAEVDQDGPRLRVAFWESGENTEAWDLDYEEVLAALLEAKLRLGFD